MILVTGASGRVGRRVAELLAGGEQPLRLMSRRPERAPGYAHVDRYPGDFREPDSLELPFRGVSLALMVSARAPAGEALRLHRNAFAAAARAGVKHLVYLSQLGASASSLDPRAREHHQSEEALRQSGLSYTVVRSASYLDTFLDRFDDQATLHGIEGRGAFVAREDVARGLAACARRRLESRHLFHITGPELLAVHDLPRLFSALTGRALFFCSETASEMRSRLTRAGVGQDDCDQEVGWFEAIAAREQQPVSSDLLRLTGEAPQSLKTYLRHFPHLLKHLPAR